MTSRIIFTIIFFIQFTYSFCHTDRNLMRIHIHDNNELIVEGKYIEIDRLKPFVKLFLTNPSNSPKYAEKYLKEIKHIGKLHVSKGMISISCSRFSTYNKYIEVQNEIERAFNELRNELSLEVFKKGYKDLDKERKQAINKAVPKTISEAEPLFIRNKEGKLIRNPIYGRFCRFY